METTTLGIDLGTNSIGWALVKHDSEQQPVELTACGVRIFQQVLSTGSSQNNAITASKLRGQARRARRTLSRRKQRRQILLKLLSQQGLFPTDSHERQLIFHDQLAYSPYQLRQQGLDKQLTLYQFGRVLFHLCHRRGFKSARKHAFAQLNQQPKIQALIQAEEHKNIKSSRYAEGID